MTSSHPSVGFEVIRLGGNIGAEIRGLDLRQPLTPEQFEQLHAVFVEREVLVFRDQDITLDQQKTFARLFGELSIHPFSPNLDDQREVIVLDYSADNPPALTDQWHSDETFRMAPPAATILRSLVVPEYGGDTLFASMTAAYTGLSERMKQYIHGLEAVHDFKPWRPLFTSSEGHQRRLRELEREFPSPSHPVVRIHPVTGRRLINVNAQFTTYIKGLKDEESQMLLNYLYGRAQIPEFQLRVKWAPNTVVMWDNRSTQHYAPHDYFPQRRTMNRVTVAGDAEIGVTGAYTPEEGVDALPDGHNVRVTAKRPTREFERHVKEIA
ncbi:MAG: TauD/TfdA family dioxygenase [Hydrogenophaga sp.]|uniref:TauD/TfdA dioxygenase family protein n=1 Tax=Hydrogenophaga sp. TaxID=1904254 RepID=UPI001DC69ABB|nr:TauD/TfdA family dioxygenase [Hydrogenophaga sp.]MBX3609226.1 TauD/TfdA family dioxygenase [Hydrogenophaga sp.]